uniref:RING-type domain-containing protein n=1 Tax=Pavo cristatus TaxID=9049 RepID=A0A8C9F8Y7_PAVCR
MGFDPARFAAPVAAELQCKLCGRVLEEPLSTPCGHVFCAGCLLPWAARRRRCPLRCRPLAAAELRPVLPLRSLVQKLEVRCDYSPRGCGRVVRLRELPAHLAACPRSRLSSPRSHAFHPCRRWPKPGSGVSSGTGAGRERRGEEGLPDELAACGHGAHLEPRQAAASPPRRALAAAQLASTGAGRAPGWLGASAPTAKKLLKKLEREIVVNFGNDCERTAKSLPFGRVG